MHEELYYKGKKVGVTHPSGGDFHGHQDKIKAELGKRIPKNNKLRVLDIGTGFGSTAEFLSKHLARGSKLWTVDPSEEMLNNVIRKLAEEGVERRIPVEFVQAEAANLNFDNDFFDVVVSVMVLHHIEDLNAVIEELMRVLKKGGKLLLVDYLPIAGKELEFHIKHRESDFFAPKEVIKSIEKVGVARTTLKRARLWYLVTAAK